MKLKFSEKLDPRLNAETLRKALDYSPQHRNGISKVLKTKFPDRWPKGSLSEEGFYQAFYTLLTNPAARTDMVAALEEAAKQKKKNWEGVFNFTKRLMNRALSVTDCQVIGTPIIESSVSTSRQTSKPEGESDKQKNREGVLRVMKQPIKKSVAVTEHQVASTTITEDSSEILHRASEAGFPEIGWWFDWWLSVSETGHEPHQKALSQNLSSDALRKTWRETLSRVETQLQKAKEEPPSSDLVAWLEERVSRLEKIAKDYAAASDLEALIREGSKLFESMAAIDHQELQKAVSQGLQAIAAYKGSRQELESWLDRMKPVAERLQGAAAEEGRHHADLQEAVSRKDYDQVASINALAKEAGDRYRLAVGEFSQLVEEAAVSGDRRDEIGDSETAPDAEKNSDDQPAKSVTAEPSHPEPPTRKTFIARVRSMLNAGVLLKVPPILPKSIFGTRAEKADARAEKADNRPKKADAQAEKADARAEKADAQAEKADARAEKADARAEKADARPEKADARPEKADARPEKADARPEKADAQVERTDHEIQIGPARDQGDLSSPSDGDQREKATPPALESKPPTGKLEKEKAEPTDEAVAPTAVSNRDGKTPSVEQRPVHDWKPEKTVEELAQAVLQHRGQQRLRNARSLAWALIHDGRIPLAYHLAEVIAKQDDSGRDVISSESLRAIHLGNYLDRGADEEVVEIASTLRRFYEVGPADGPLQSKRAQILLDFAALLRPALIAPYATDAEELMRRLPLDETLSSLHHLREQVIDQKVRFSALTHLDPKNRLEVLRKKVQAWYESNRRHHFKYEPATWVWTRLLKSDQPLGRAVSVVLHGGKSELGEAKRLLATLGNRSDADRLIDSADKEIRARKASKKPIEAGPRTDMVKRCSTLADFLTQWVDAFEDQANSIHAHSRENALREARKRLLDRIDQALVQLDKLKKTTGLEERAAAICVRRVVENVKQRLQDGESVVPPEQSAWWRSLNGVLLASDAYELIGERWEVNPLCPAEELLPSLAKLVSPPNWEAVLREAESRCDHVRTEQLLDWLRLEEGFDAQRLESWDQRRERSLKNCKQKLSKKLEQVQNEVERAAALGYLGEQQRAQLAASLEALDRKEIEDLRGANEEIARIQQVLGTLKAQQVGEIRQRMEKSEALKENSSAKDKIDERLAAGDILTANEYLSLLESGEPIPEPAERRDAFKDEFFPDFVEKIQSYLDKSSSGGVWERIERGADVGPLNMRQVPGAQCQSAARMLRAWMSLKAKRGNPEDKLREFLSGLGFSEVAVTPRRANVSEQTFDVSVRPVADGDICMVPRYGSHAAGQYKFICIWGRPPEEDVLTSAKTHSDGHPVIVLYMGRLSVKRWRNLSVRCRDRRQTLLAIDETLVYFLCGERGSRLATFFDCALPFTVAQPYVTTSSNVPPELFFGRRRELEAIFDHTGTNLVYGGRQLGKTALLREVVRRFHRPKAGVIVAWLDLKERLIGLSEPADMVWRLIDEELARQGIFRNAKRTPDGTADAIQRWLNKESQRRIVMLLDEADAFLAQDARDKQFQTVAKLKGLMERTENRFKVVFAGLHNVQRTSQDINTPLAHFGKPLCVGPLLSNGEAREAYQLVERPLHQLGYRFESPALINRILAQTNYYPNLIQIFCTHLLEHLQDVGSGFFDPKTTPPYVIERKHVEAVSQNRDLQQTIRSRFQITLDLDTRYQVVALSIALESRKSEGVGEEEVDGMAIAEIRKEALNWWPQGFPDRTRDAFRALLDEMVDLGVLRRAGNDFKAYALRSPAIASLLGTPSEIEEALLEASEKEPPEIYEASTHRRGRPGDLWVRSPLTGQQESEILAEKDAVLILFGTRLSGLDRLNGFLKEMVKGKDFITLDFAEGMQDKNRFERRLQQTLDKAKGDTGLQLLVVPHTEPWTRDWVSRATHRLASRRSTRSQVRVLFVGDARDAWEWTTAGNDSEDMQVEVFSLAPWIGSFITQWSKDTGFGPLGKEDLAEWAQVTGWWGGLLASLGERLKENPMSWKRTFESFKASVPETVREMLMKNIPKNLADPLCILAKYQAPLSCEDWLELFDPPIPADAPAHLQQIVRWADLLGLLSPTEGERWIIDPIVGRALSS